MGKIDLMYRDEVIDWVWLTVEEDNIWYPGDLFEKLHKIVISSIPYIFIYKLDGFTANQRSLVRILTDSKSGFLRFAPSLIRYTLK